jgi:hypothetical protein
MANREQRPVQHVKTEADRGKITLISFEKKKKKQRLEIEFFMKSLDLDVEMTVLRLRDEFERTIK